MRAPAIVLGLSLLAVAPAANAQSTSYRPQPPRASVSADRLLQLTGALEDLRAATLFAAEQDPTFVPPISLDELASFEERLVSGEARQEDVLQLAFLLESVEAASTTQVMAMQLAFQEDSTDFQFGPAAMSYYTTAVGSAANSVSNVGASAGASIGGLSATRVITDVVIPSIERQYRATAQATAMNAFRVALCSPPSQTSVAPAAVMLTYSADMFIRTCAVLGNRDQFESATPWSTAKEAFEGDLERLPQRLASALPNTTPTLVREVLPAAIEFGVLAGSGVDAAELLVGLRGVACELANDPDTRVKRVAVPIIAIATGVETVVTEVEKEGAQLTDHVRRAARNFVTEMRTSCVASEWPARSIDVLVAELEPAFRTLYHLQAHLREVASTPIDNERGDRFETYLRALISVLEQAGRLVPWGNTLTAAELAAFDEDIDRAIQILRQGLMSYDAFRRADYARGFVELLTLAEVAEVGLPEQITRWGPFMADVAQAKTSDDLNVAVNAILAPVGTFREKRVDGAWTFAINAHVGGRGGVERAYGSQAGGTEAFFGVFAPVGFEVSHGFGSFSLGGLFSIADVGAHLNYNIDDIEDDEDLDNAEDVNFGQIFAPGVFLTVGISKNWPMSAGAGFSLLRERRKATDNQTGDVVGRNVLQFSLFAAFDVPLLIF